MCDSILYYIIDTAFGLYGTILSQIVVTCNTNEKSTECKSTRIPSILSIRTLIFPISIGEL